MFDKVTRLFVRIVPVTLALATTSSAGGVQSFVCDTIRAGETASAVARRVTGRASSQHQRWFRIVDRARSRIVPKAEYNRILAGWQACIPAPRVAARVSSSAYAIDTIAQNETTRPLASPPKIAPRQPLSRGAAVSRDVALALAIFLLAPAAFGAAIGFGWQGVERVLTKRRALQREIRDFGNVFVKEFERPLVVDRIATRPIRARLRWVSRHRRLDIMLAPAAGRRYPNLYDHRRNVEYDVERIAHQLKTRPFIRKPLRAEGEWVVIPFQLEPNPKTGAFV